MFTVDWDRNKDLPTGKVSYEGAVSLEKLRHGCPTTRILRKGDLIPGTNTHLQADNYGIHFNDLYKHLNTLIKYLSENEPPAWLTQDFCNPYSGHPITQAPECKAKATVDCQATQNTYHSRRNVWRRIFAWFTKR